MASLKLIAKILVSGLGIISFSIAGCTQSPNTEVDAQEQRNIQSASSTSQAQASPNSTTQTPSRSPDVIYVPTPTAVVKEMLRLANVQSSDRVYDLGSGDGRIVITAAKERGAQGIGIDIDPQRIREANENAEKAGVSDRVQFRQQDLFQTDLSNATVVTLYLLPTLNLKLRPKLLQELKPGTRIVSHQFDMGDWKPEKVVKVGDRTVYYWVVPEQKTQS